MIALWQIERRCTGLAGTLHNGVRDEIVLLRMARTLKRIYGELQRELWARARREGWTHDTAQAEAALEGVEHDLRRVLLEHHSLQPQEMNEHLQHAVGNALDAVEKLMLD